MSMHAHTHAHAHAQSYTCICTWTWSRTVFCGHTRTRTCTDAHAPAKFSAFVINISVSREKDLLRNIRSQRAGMINQDEQYVFAYQMILDEVLKLAAAAAPPHNSSTSPATNSSTSPSTLSPHHKLSWSLIGLLYFLFLIHMQCSDFVLLLSQFFFFSSLFLFFYTFSFFFIILCVYARGLKSKTLWMRPCPFTYWLLLLFFILYNIGFMVLRDVATSRVDHISDWCIQSMLSVCVCWMPPLLWFVNKYHIN